MSKPEKPKSLFEQITGPSKRSLRTNKLAANSNKHLGVPPQIATRMVNVRRQSRGR